MKNKNNNIKKYIKKFPIITHLGRFIIDYINKSRKPITTVDGFKITGNKSMMEGSFEPDETQIINKILKTTTVFINIGANIGYFILHSIKSGCKYNIAIEPMKSNINSLIKNLEINEWESKVEIYPIAVSSDIGVVSLYGVGTGASMIEGWANSSTHIKSKVPLNTLDNIAGERFNAMDCLILIDIEGGEYLALQGGLKLVKKNPKPIWIVEVCLNEHLKEINNNFIKVFKIFYENGYQAWTCEINPKKIEFSDVEFMQKTGINKFNTHNFIFSTEDKMRIIGLI
jgi:FkbM family methyltransferase